VGASRRFLTRLILITAGAAAWRVYYISGPVLSRISRLGIDDEFFYSAQARLLADGKGFVNPFGYFAPIGSPAHRVFETAVHPPLYSLYLAVPAKFGLSTPAEQRIFTALLGVATVFLIGILARRLAGDRVGLIAAFLAAVSPALWSNDSVLGLESLYGLLLVLALLTLYRFWNAPTIGRAAVLGLWLALATLTRSEGIILSVLIAVPAVMLVRGVTRVQRWKMFGAIVAVGIVIVSPWVIRNLTTFERPTLLGTGYGWVLAYGSCDTTYYGSKLGSWDDSCALKDYPPHLEESLIDERAREKALDYIKNHKSRVPIVVAARVGRLFELYKPVQNVELNQGERRGEVASWAILVGYYLLLPWSIAGLIVLRRRRIPIFPFLAVVAATTITVASSFAITRYRAPIDVIMPVLAAVAIDATVHHFARRRAAPDDAAAPSAPPEPPEPAPEPVATVPPSP
jgi:4-amino-4-deoxy-L-arabinose transferase-like glycosyltransferase